MTCDPPVAPSPEVVSELSGLHPGPTKAHQEVIDQLRGVGPGAVPIIDPDMVRFLHSQSEGPARRPSRALTLLLRGSSLYCGGCADF